MRPLRGRPSRAGRLRCGPGRRRGGRSPPPPRSAAGAPAKSKPAANPSREREGSRKLTYKDQRDYDLLPGRIDEIDAAIARDEAALADPDLYVKDPARFAALSEAIAKARAERDAAEERWLELAEKVEALAG